MQSAGVAPTFQTLYGAAEHHGRYGVLIHDSYPDVRLFHSLLCGSFPSRWLQLLQWPMVSLLGVPDQVKKRVCYRTNAVHELPSPLVHLL